jgi:hypothetical protein
MTENEAFDITVRSQADLERTWRILMEPLGFSGHSLWLMFIDADDHPLPQITEIAEMPERIDAAGLAGFSDFLEHLRREYAVDRVAALLTRPGAGGLTAADRESARHVHDACRRSGMATEVVHVATDTVLAPVPLDDLSLPGSAA